VAVLESEESMCITKSPSRRMEGEREKSWVRNSYGSERKVGFEGSVDHGDDQGFRTREFECQLFK